MHSLGPGGHPGPGDRRAVHRRGGQRAALLRHGVRRGPHPAQRARGRGGLRRGDPARRRATTWPTRWPRCTTSTPTRSGWATWGGTRGTSSASSSAGAGSTTRCRSRASTTAALVERVERRAGPAHPQAAAHLGRARRLPHGQRRAGRRRHGPGHPRLGDLHARRPPGRPRAADGLLGRPRRRHGGARAVADDGARVLHPGPGAGALRLGRPTSTSRASATTRPSATGSWPASSRASTPATSPAPARATRAASTASRSRSAASSRWRPRRWSRRREPRGHGLTEIFEVHREPVLHEPVLVVALEGWVDAGLGATTAIAALLGQGHDRADRHLQRRALPRPAGPAAGGPHRQRRHHRADLAPHRRAPGARTSRGATCSSWSAPSPTSTGAPSPTPWSGWPAPGGCAWWSGWGPSRRPAPHTRPVKLAATAPASSAHLIEQVGIVQGELEVPAGVLSALEMAFGGDGHAGGEPVGPGAPLRGGHAVPRGRAPR